MTQQPLSAAAMRGAVDLSSLGKKKAAPGGAASSQPPVKGLVVATDQTFEAVVNASTTVPAVMVVWSPQVPESKQHADALVGLSKDYQGRFQVVGVEVDSNPGILQALTPMLQQTFGQVDALPIVLGLVGGQPMPFYLGVQDVSALRPLMDKFLEAAKQQGVNGTADVGAADEVPTEPEMPPLHAAAVDAIDRGDLSAAAAAYAQAVQENPADDEARLGLAQVSLLERASTMDAAQVRNAAAEAPTDVAAQSAAADLEIVGGHVEDAFNRMIDLVRHIAGDERAAARDHLLELFDVIGSTDPRVTAARRALTNALF